MTIKDKGNKENKDYSLWYFMANIIVFVIVYLFLIIVVVNLVHNISIDIVIAVVFLYPWAYFEEHHFSKYVGYAVEKIIKVINKY